MQTTYQADRIFTGTEWINNQTSIITEEGVIKDMVPATTQPAGEVIDLRGKLIIPAFIDLQIYGANKKLLAVYPTVEALHDLYSYCANGGAPLFQPTVATNKSAVFYAAIDAVRKYWAQNGKGVIGLHIEGPWI